MKERLKRQAVVLSHRIALAYCICLIVPIGCNNTGEKERIGTDLIDIPASAHHAENTESDAQISFEQKEFIVGDMVQGEIKRFEFKFENTGNDDLVIASVTGSCGCTVPLTYPRGAIAPGDGGIIEMEFDSKGKSNDQTMTVSVVTNSVPNLTQLIIRANILVPDNMKNK